MPEIKIGDFVKIIRTFGEFRCIVEVTYMDDGCIVAGGETYLRGSLTKLSNPFLKIGGVVTWQDV